MTEKTWTTTTEDWTDWKKTVPTSKYLAPREKFVFGFDKPRDWVEWLQFLVAMGVAAAFVVYMAPVFLVSALFVLLGWGGPNERRYKYPDQYPADY